MAKKTTKKPKPKRREKRAVHRTESPPASPPLQTAPAPLAKSKPVARMRRSLLTPAERRGAELVRFLRIHSKRPYGARGERAIENLAIEAAHLARLELADRDKDAPTTE